MNLESETNKEGKKRGHVLQQCTTKVKHKAANLQICKNL